MRLELNDHLAANLPAHDEAAAFDAVLTLRGETYRRHKHRHTFRASIGGRDYFIKTHRHAGWREILKDALRLRRPIVTAEPERRAIERFAQHRIPTVRIAGSGTRGRNPGRMESFIITEPLEGFVHLDEVVATLEALPPHKRFRAKRRIIEELAALASRMHGAGMNHRDFYLGHFMLPRPNLPALGCNEDLDLHVIDLHRVQIRDRVPCRWIEKDLAGLLFSSLDAPLTGIDCLRFLRRYWGDGWRERLQREKRSLRAIRSRASALYRSEHGRDARLPAGPASS